MSKLVVCKTCGNDDLTEISEGILKCKYCRHLTERPKENADLMERAHNLRFNSKDFDEAAKIYEEVIRLTPNEAEAYWGRVLCCFGIEYVKDTNGEYLPTCHRTIQSSILDDADYLMAVKKASGELKDYYTAQAKLIDTYQTKIKVIAAKEQPYDVFISFKATDNGKPTEDSLIAQEIYYYLTKNLGLKVFFSNITLKDKAGQEYEPIIFAALSSATVMVLVGTKNEYINATWVKNEWSRYIGMVADAKKQNKSKYIVTAIKGMRPEELPSALASYQAVNIGELGAKEKLCSNIDSLIGDLRVNAQKKSSGNMNPEEMLAAEAANLCNLGFQSIAMGETDKASDYFQKALEKKSDTSLAFWGKLLLSEKVTSDEALARRPIRLQEYSLYKLAIENATEDEKQHYESIASKCEESIRMAGVREQHNAEYRSEIEKAKYTYANRESGDEAASIDAETNRLFKEYDKSKVRLSEAKKNRSRYLNKTDLYLHRWILVALAAIILLVIPSFGAERAVDNLNEHFIEKANFNLIETLEQANIGVTDVFDSSIDASYFNISEEQALAISEASASINLGDYTASLVMMIVPLFLVCAVLLFLLGKKIKGILLGILAAWFFGLPIAGILTYLIFMVSLPSSVNWVMLAGFALAGIMVLIFILRAVRNSKIKTELKNSGIELDLAMKEQSELYKEIMVYSGKVVESINEKYRNLYGDQVDATEPNYVIAVDSLNASEDDLKKLFGVESAT